MRRKIKTQIEKAKQFAQDHPTLVACAATGIVSWKISHDATLKGVLNAVYEQTYTAGYDVGALEVQNSILLDFINSRGLGDEVRQYVLSLKD
jgi:hypothetical protein